MEKLWFHEWGKPWWSLAMHEGVRKEFVLVLGVPTPYDGRNMCLFVLVYAFKCFSLSFACLLFLFVLVYI